MKWVYAPVRVCGWTGTSEDIRIPERKTRDRAMYQRKASALRLHLDSVGQEGEDLLRGRAKDGPAAARGVWEGHGLSQAPQHGATQGRALGSEVLLKLLQPQTLHIHLELVLSHVLHPRAQSLIEVGPGLVLGETDSQ